MRLATILCALGVGLAGCANPGVVQLAPDTYMLSKTDRAGIFGNTAALKAEVINEANAFAASQGKVAIALTAREVPLVPGQRFATYEYQFRVVDKNDPEAKRVTLVPRANVVVEHNGAPAPAPAAPREASKKDVYAELLKLDDLRKRGILSEAEFEAQKRKLLADN